MAQEYGIDIQRWNGNDYDTLKPTPDAHASTHQANGSDPLILQTGNYGNKTVTSDKLGDAAVATSKIANNAVTRAKLANDALYSPVKVINYSAHVISADDIGKTLFVSISGDVSITLDKEVADALPVGTEIAVCAFTSPNVTITLNGVRVCIFDEAIKGTVNGSVSLAVQIPHGMVALKKVYKQTTYGDLWFVTGNVEVVS